MKPSRLTFLLLLALLPLALSAQVLGNYPTGCSCVNFKYACSGQSAAFPGGSVRVFCPDGTSRTSALSGEATGYCPTRFDCPSPERICLSYKNWHICNFQGCNAQVFQTLPRNPQINGETLGLYPLEGGSGAIFSCVGTDYATNINSVITRDKFLLCPGDEVVLKLPDFELPAASGLCLTVNVLDESGSLVEGGTFEHDAPELGGEDLNLTELFAGLSTGTIYRLEIILTCCDAEAESDCNMMTVKRAYFELEGQFSYTPYAVFGGSGFGTCNPPPPAILLSPYTSPFGPVLTPVAPCDQVSLFLTNIQNPQGTDLTLTLTKLDCSTGADDTQIGSFTVPSSSLGAVYATPLVGGRLPNECECYRLDFEYDEGCGEGGEVTDSYYFQWGDVESCNPPLNGGSTSFLQSGGDLSPAFSLMPNPVQGELSLQWGEIPQEEAAVFNLTIFNGLGQVVRTVAVPNEGQRFSMPADMPAGAYHYVVDWPNGRHSGTFIKAGR